MPLLSFFFGSSAFLSFSGARLSRSEPPPGVRYEERRPAYLSFSTSVQYFEHFCRMT
jgi:hypothetical protein